MAIASSAADKEKAAAFAPRFEGMMLFIKSNMKGRCAFGKTHRPIS
ncbi:hypothetical protein [Sphingopyxis sp. KK2]|nr:hypothetical protein [Sphingopyxis sp. KK2]